MLLRLVPLVCCLALWMNGCAPPPDGAPRVRSQALEVAVPAPPGAMAPGLAASADTLLVTWLEPAELAAGAGHRLRFARLEDGVLSPPVSIAEGSSFFANWADVPGLGVAPDGTLVAHWLTRTGEETYSYSIDLARSTDQGASWSPLGRLDDDETPGEHGFVSWVREGERLRAFWLDGRDAARSGAMTLRTALVGEEVEPSELLDARVCDCCPTTAATSARGTVVLYRDRSPAEVRDIAAMVGGRGAPWGEPVLVHRDGWKIDGCPVNGPGVATAGEATVAAWFTAAAGQARVWAAFSSDGVESFADPVRVDAGSPLGRLGVVGAADGTAVVSWLETVGDGAELRLRRVWNGGAGEVLPVARTASARAAGVPRIALVGERLWVAWIETDGRAPGRLRLRGYDAAGI